MNNQNDNDLDNNDYYKDQNLFSNKESINYLRNNQENNNENNNMIQDNNQSMNNNNNLNKDKNMNSEDENNIYNNNNNYNKNSKIGCGDMNDNNNYMRNNLDGKNTMNDNEDISNKEESQRISDDIIKSNYYEKCESLKLSEGTNKIIKNSNLSQDIDKNSKIQNEKDSTNNKRHYKNNNSPFEINTNSDNNNYNKDSNAKNNKDYYDKDRKNRGYINNHDDQENYNNKNKIKFNNVRNDGYDKSNFNKNIKNNRYNNYNTYNNKNSENYKNEFTFNNNINNIKRNVIYQDFFYKEIKYGSNCSSSSNRSSLNSQQNNNNYNEQNDIRKSYPYDNDGNNQIIDLQNRKEPEDEFSKYIFNQINNIRRNPKSFINTIESSIKNIIIDKRNNFIYKGKQRMALNNGVYAFKNTIQHLQVLKSMNELIYNPNMNIKLPSNEEEINNRNYQHDMVHYLLKNKIKINSFWRELVKDPDECILLMIVDDCGSNCGFKRKDLLNPNMKYIGINSVKIEKYFACYITLGK